MSHLPRGSTSLGDISDKEDEGTVPLMIGSVTKDIGQDTPGLQSALSNSKTISWLTPHLRTVLGTYRVTWGPMMGQYRPRLKPLRKATPLLQPVGSRKVSLGGPALQPMVKLEVHRLGTSVG